MNECTATRQRSCVRCIIHVQENNHVCSTLGGFVWSFGDLKQHIQWSLVTKIPIMLCITPYGLIYDAILSAVILCRKLDKYLHFIFPGWIGCVCDKGWSFTTMTVTASNAVLLKCNTVLEQCITTINGWCFIRDGCVYITYCVCWCLTVWILAHEQEFSWEAFPQYRSSVLRIYRYWASMISYLHTSS